MNGVAQKLSAGSRKHSVAMAETHQVKVEAFNLVVSDLSQLLRSSCEPCRWYAVLDLSDLNGCV